MNAKRPIDVHAIANEAAMQGVIGRVAERLGDTVEARAEGLLHELCHVAVFGMSDDVAMHGGAYNAVFKRFNSYSANNSIMADASECAALAVERDVLHALGWSLDFDAIVAMAHEDMRTMSYSAMEREIERAAARKATPIRARRVLRWLAEITAQYG